MMGRRTERPLRALIFGLTLIVILCAQVAKAQENIRVRIDHYTHKGCVVDGKRLKPAYASEGEASFFWLPRQSQSCVGTIQRGLVACEWATSFVHSSDEEQYPGCLTTFGAEVSLCKAHYSAVTFLCERRPNSQTDERHNEARELDKELERIALQQEQERLEEDRRLEKERNLMALQEELEMLEEQQRLEKVQQRRELAAQQREREHQSQLAFTRQRQEKADNEALEAFRSGIEMLGGILQLNNQLRLSKEPHRKNAPAASTYSRPTFTPLTGAGSGDRCGATRGTCTTREP